jgi:hypothetical protein
VKVDFVLNTSFNPPLLGKEQSQFKYLARLKSDIKFSCRSFKNLKINQAFNYIKRHKVAKIEETKAISSL